MPPSDPIIEELLAALRSDKTTEEEKMTLNYSVIWLLWRWESSHQRINYSFSRKCLSSTYSEFFRRQNQPQTPNSHYNMGSFDMAHQPTTPTTPYGHAPQARRSNTPQSLKSSYSGMMQQCMPPPPAPMAPNGPEYTQISWLWLSRKWSWHLQLLSLVIACTYICRNWEL